jgi:hypothetical protein
MDGHKEYVQIDQNDLFPFLLVNVGSGVSIIKVTLRLAFYFILLWGVTESFLLFFFTGWWAWEVSASKWDKCWWWYILGIGEVNDKVQEVLFSAHGHLFCNLYTSLISHNPVILFQFWWVARVEPAWRQQHHWHACGRHIRWSGLLQGYYYHNTWKSS